jgi:hypothetical protein
MILNELTNADAIEAVREETREETREVTWKEASEATRQATWEETQQQVFALIDQGLTGEQFKQAFQRERLRVVPQTTKTESFKH